MTWEIIGIAGKDIVHLGYTNSPKEAKAYLRREEGWKRSSLIIRRVRTSKEVKGNEQSVLQ